MPIGVFRCICLQGLYQGLQQLDFTLLQESPETLLNTGPKEEPESESHPHANDQDDAEDLDAKIHAHAHVAKMPSSIPDNCAKKWSLDGSGWRVRRGEQRRYPFQYTFQVIAVAVFVLPFTKAKFGQCDV